MTGELVFRNVLLAIAVPLMSVALYHRLQAHTAEKLDRRQEGPAILFPLRLFGLGCWGGLIAYLIHPASLSWSSLPLPQWLRWVGAACAAAAVPLVWWVMHSLGANLTDTVVTRAQAKLVTHGPYRWVRHPLYTSASLFFLGASLLAATWFFAAMFFPALVLLMARTRIEEAKLVDRFGDAYVQYMRRTGRFLPRLNGSD